MTATPSSPRTLNRRDFLKTAGLVATAATFGLPRLFAAEPAPAMTPTPGFDPYSVAILEKWFFDGGPDGANKYTPEQMAQTLDEIGLDLELTLREQGHITPEKAPDELPVMAAALAKKGRRITCLATDTVRPDEPHWEKAIRAGKALGIPQYRHRGFKYVEGRPLKAQIADFHAMAKDFEAINRQIGIQAVYQIHSGRQMAGSAAWDLDLILGDIDPRWFGVAFDAQHVMIEQGMSWPNAVELLAPRTVALCVKSFKWVGDGTVGVPLGQGRVKKTIVDQVIAAHGGPLPIVIHDEYFMDKAGKLSQVPFADRAAIVAAFRADAQVLRTWLGVS